jgi:hypothetical protein
MNVVVKADERIPTLEATRVKIAIKQLERRVSKLEAQAAVSAQAEMRIEISKLYDFLTTSEMQEFARLYRAGDAPAMRMIILRSTTRRERYPLLWLGLHRHRSGHPAIPEPWSVEAEIEALRNDVARMWEWRGLALDLDALTTDDLTILDHLLPKWTYGLAYWFFVKQIATPTEIEAVLAKVVLVARAIDRDDSGQIIAWEDVGRPLNWGDLKLDPATFPWEEWRKWEDQRKADKSSWRRSPPETRTK